jgi:hypothetical protein
VLLDNGFAILRAAKQTGRRLGTAGFIKGLERILGRPTAWPVHPAANPSSRSAISRNSLSIMETFPLSPYG